MTYFFISTWGILGAAYSAAITGLITNIVGFNLAQKRYRLSLERTKILVIIGTALGLFMLITRWELEGNAFYELLISQTIPWFADLVQKTFLGTFKGGKAITILLERSQPIAEITLRGLAALTYLLLLPMVHEGFRFGIMRQVNKLRR